MGSPDDTSPPEKPTNLRHLSASTTLPPAQDSMPMPAYTADWAASVQAYYSSGAPPPTAFFPNIWGGQHLMYGAPIAYPPMYPPGTVFAHPFMAPGMGFPTADTESIKSKRVPRMSGEGGKASSCSEEENTSQRCASATDDSSDTRDMSSDPQESPKKRSYKDAFQEGDASQLAIATPSGRAPKLPVSAPGRTMLPDPTTNLNIGMDIWNTPHSGSATLEVRPVTEIVPPIVGANTGIVDRRWIQSEREIKKERRKQSNRESARRSRLRKLQECDELARNVAELNGEKSALRLELDQLHKVCKDLEAENHHIAEQLRSLQSNSPYSSREKDRGGDKGHFPR